jgi:predicted alpha/beta-fold hydrolase
MDYTRPFLLFNRHLETVYPALFRSINVAFPKSERITTSDHDFLDLDWYLGNSKKLVIISHGLEGNSKRAYVLGMTKAFIQQGYDVLAWNFRGCSGELNMAQRFYHSGATDDLDTVVQHALSKALYQSISLIGFSLGGNLTLKYLGEGYASASRIRNAVAISVPLDLDSSCQSIAKGENWAYEYRFLRSLKSKVREKGKKMTLPNLQFLDRIKKLREFDDLITGPLHGFKDAQDYYHQCSSIHFLSTIKTPTLILNARNDPFLSPACFPENVGNKQLQFMYPAAGGHVGFTLFNEKKLYWSEIQALQFIDGLEVRL